MSPSRAASRKRAASRAALARVGVEARALVVDPAAGAAEDLARVGLGDVEDLGDVGERVVEGLAQHEHGALVGVEPLEQDEERSETASSSSTRRPASSSTSGSGSHEPV